MICHPSLFRPCLRLSFIIGNFVKGCLSVEAQLMDYK